LPEQKRTISACKLKKTIEDANGWIFFYNSLRFIQTGDSINMLAGNGPIFISKSGKETILPSNIPWWEALSKLRDGL